MQQPSQRVNRRVENQIARVDFDPDRILYLEAEFHCREAVEFQLDNPFVVQALAEQGLSEPVTIGVGESSLEEMCVILFGVATDLPIEDLL